MRILVCAAAVAAIASNVCFAEAPEGAASSAASSVSPFGSAPAASGAAAANPTGPFAAERMARRERLMAAAGTSSAPREMMRERMRERLAERATSGPAMMNRGGRMGDWSTTAAADRRARRMMRRGGETSPTAYMESAPGPAGNPASMKEGSAAEGGAAPAAAAGGSAATASADVSAKGSGDFSGTDSKGETHSLAKHKGSVVVVEFTNPACPIVQRVYRSNIIKKVYEKYKGQGVVWIAVDSNKDASNDKENTWIAAQKLDYPILVDPEGKIGHQLGAKSTPGMFVYDKQGNLAYSGAIDDDPLGETENPKNYVDEALAKVLKGEKPEVTSTQSYGCGVHYK